MRDWDILTFDCYGTLVDWEAGLGDALESLLRPHGVEASREQFLLRFAHYEERAEAGEHLRYRDVLARVSGEIATEYAVDLTGEERGALARSLPEWPVFPDTVAALRRLAAHYRLGILSNIDDDLFAGTSLHLGVEFAPVVTAEQVGSYKPARANFETLLDRVGVPADRLLHVAQSVFHDIVPATELGLQTVWVDRRGGESGGATPASDFEPAWRVGSLADLADAICD